MKSLSLKTKILGLSMGLVATIVIIGASNMYMIKSIVDRYQNILHVNMENIQNVDDMQLEVETASRLYIRLVLENNSTEEIQRNTKDFEDAIVSYKKTDKEYTDIPFGPGEDELYKEVKAKYEAWEGIAREIVVLANKNTPADHAAALNIVKTTASGARRNLNSALDKLVEYHDNAADKNAAETTQSKDLANTLSLALLLIGSIVGLIASYLFATVLSRTLRDVTKNINDSSAQVNSASEQLSSAGQQLSAGTTEAASSLAETVASVEELSSMVKMNADHAREAASLSTTSREAAEAGETQIKNLNSAMGEIAQSSRKIEEIINVIDDIAFQTNLLALNAAVEAARAGEQGKGFAVVAEAVRNLAQRSAAAAKDITGLIKESVTRIDRGTKVADEGAKALGSIVVSVKKVADLNNEIAAASQEQSSGLTNITKAMNELDRSTQQNASSAEETAAASVEMSSQAVVLGDMVTRLSEIVDGLGGKKSLDKHSSAREVKTKSAPSRTASKNAVVQLHPKIKGRQNTEEIFPMDNNQEEPAPKLGTTNGF